MIVPPVPTPATKMSTCRPCRPRSLGGRAPVRLGVGGVLELRGMNAPGVSCADRPRCAMAPLMPCAPGVRTISAPYARRRLRRSRLMFSGIVRTVAARGGDHREGDAGVAARRLDDRRPTGRERPASLGVVDHREADAVLDAAAGVERSSLATTTRRPPRAAQPDERRAADQRRDVFCDLHWCAPLVALSQISYVGPPAAELQLPLGEVARRWCAPGRPDRRPPRHARRRRRWLAPRGSDTSPGGQARSRATPSSASTTARTLTRSGRRAKVNPPPTPRWPVRTPARRRVAKSCSRYCSGISALARRGRRAARALLHHGCAGRARRAP